MTQFTNMLDDPHYWSPDYPYERIEINMRIATLLVTVLCVTLIAILVVVFKTTESNNAKWVKLERQCLDQGGQWIRNDCVNNIIKING